MTFAQPFSEYEVLDRIGAGSMGTVFKARHKTLNRTVALKVLKPSLARDARYVDRLRREARIVASLNHPNIVTGYDLGQEGGYHFFVMEFVEGKSLRELLSEWGMFAEERVLDVAIQITIALNHAYAKGVIHRDIKPANILIAGDNVVKLTDMGLAKGPDNLAITRDGATLGTPQYISPEQAKSPQDVDVRSDLYSLGATLFHMCTGQPPFRAETMANVLVKVLEERAPSAAGINPDLSDGLNLIIRKLLSKDPDRRYQTPSELLADLERVRRAELPQVDPSDLDTGEESEGRTRTAWVLAGIGVPMIALLAWLATPPGDAPPKPLLEPRAEYRDEVITRLTARVADRAPKLGEKYQALRVLEADLQTDDQTEWKREVLDFEREALETQIRGELIRVVNYSRKTLENEFENMSWTGWKTDLRDHVADAVREAVGMAVEDLPRAAREIYPSYLGRVLSLGETLQSQRVAEHRGVVGEYAPRVVRDIAVTLPARGIDDAETQLRNAIADFDNLDAPPIAQLPEELREFVERSRDECEAKARKVIDEFEKTLREDFDRELQVGVGQFENVVKSDVESLPKRDVQASIARFDDFRTRIEGDYPDWRFRETANPWSKARQQLGETRRRLVEKDEAVARFAWLGARQRAYGLAAAGELTDAKSELGFRAEGFDAERVGRHEELLDAAGVVRRKLLRILLGNKQSRSLKVRSAGQPLTVELTRRRSKLVLLVDAKVVPLASVGVRSLVEDLAPKFVETLRPAERAGLALWYWLSDRDADIASLLVAPWAELMKTEIRDLTITTPTPDSVVAQTKLRKAMHSADQGDLQAAEEGLAMLRAGHEAFVEKNAQDISTLVLRIRHAKRRSAIERRLKTRMRAGMRSLVDREDLSVTVDVDATHCLFPQASRRGWVPALGQPIRFSESRLTLEEALEKTLVIPSLLDADEPATVVIELSFPAEMDAPRVVFLGFHGATIGLGIIKSGLVTTFKVDGDLKPARGPVLRSLGIEALRLAREAGPSVTVTPSARHRLELDIGRRQKSGSTKWKVTARLDGVELPAAIVERQSTPKAEWSLTPLSPVSVYSIQFRGRG